MYTFNLALVFGNSAVVTFVCASENPVDTMQINMVASTAVREGTAFCQNAEQLAHYIVERIKENCGCDAVMVVSDVVLVLGAGNEGG